MGTYSVPPRTVRLMGIIRYKCTKKLIQEHFKLGSGKYENIYHFIFLKQYLLFDTIPLWYVYHNLGTRSNGHPAVSMCMGT